MPQGEHDAWLAAAFFEFGARLHRQDDAGECFIEFVDGYRARAGGGIVQVNFAAAKTFDNDEVVEIPEDDVGIRKGFEILKLFAESLRNQTVFARGLDNV